MFELVEEEPEPSEQVEVYEPSGNDVEWEFGGEGNLNVLTCPQDVRHPVTVHVG
ncbi:hypothetical protein [Lentzea sp.]|uniref:hypothetical protein n=1 Tax=Lentzea sp. TaxID=56099 RepID=UPI002ED6BE5A